MKINFKRLEIFNFMSFADEIFDLNAQTGMNLITGKNLDIPNSKNGSGKSNLFAALLYGLFGQLSTKIKGEHISNRNSGTKEVRVVVYLDVDNASYKVVSGLNKRAQSYFQIFTLDGENETDITKSSIAESRTFFETEIIHCDISLFLRTVLLSSEQNYNFFNLNKLEKKIFIEQIFDINVFGEMYDTIHKDSLMFDKDINAEQNQLIVLNKNEEDTKTRLDNFNTTKTSKLSLLTETISGEKTKLENLLKTTVEKNTELISKCEEAISKLTTDRNNISQKYSSMNTDISKVKQEISYNNSLKAEREKIISKHSELLGKLCSDCKTVFSSYHNLTEYSSEIEKIIKKNEEKKTALDTLISTQKDLANSISEIDEKLRKIQTKYDNLTSESNKINSQKNILERNIASYENQYSSLESQVNPFVEVLEHTKVEIENHTKKLNEILEKYRYLKKAEEVVSQESLKKYIIRDLIGLINNKIKYYLTKMGAKYTCVFDENLDYSFITESGECELQNFSCGEKKRIEIATCLSFRDFISQRSNISSNILIIDEYIDSGIDTLAVESILNILKDFTKIYQQNIFIISHRYEVNSELFERIIEVQKENGISKVNYIA